MSEASAVTIGILGFGAFARLIAANLAPRFRILAHDPSEMAQAAARQSGVTVASLEEVARSSIVVLAIPLTAFEACVSDLAGRLQPGQIVIDVCSVKQEPARIMQALLPSDIDILATHPMFGRESARDGVAGHRIVLCPLRGCRWRRVAAFLRIGLELEVIVASPEDHDRQAATSQGLTHLLARRSMPLASMMRAVHCTTWSASDCAAAPVRTYQRSITRAFPLPRYHWCAPLLSFLWALSPATVRRVQALPMTMPLPS